MVIIRVLDRNLKCQLIFCVSSGSGIRYFCVGKRLAELYEGQPGVLLQRVLPLLSIGN